MTMMKVRRFKYLLNYQVDGYVDGGVEQVCLVESAVMVATEWTVDWV